MPKAAIERDLYILLCSPLLVLMIQDGRSWRHTGIERDRAQTTLRKNAVSARSLAQRAEPRVLPTLLRSFGPTCPRSGSQLVHCENSTDGTTRNLLQSLWRPQYAQRILPGLQNVVVQISTTFEGYSSKRLKVTID